MTLDPTLAGLPATSRVITRARDYLVLATPIADKLPSADQPPSADKPKLQYNHTAVIFTGDRQADPTIIHIATVLHYQCPEIRQHVCGFGKVDGRLRWWWTGGPGTTYDYARIPVIKAALAAYWPHSRIDTEPGIIVPTLADGTVDRDNLAADDLLRVVPANYKLGIVRGNV